ncbi:MAG: hypothetical protein IPP59_09635 [Betaproteobacteria bacterium]|jgi:hypothetical protein|nr:hypothetical protein [Betaproteobacteria bacterium]MBK9784417.1 hypothetical protein [Candidatus Dechloromonas phosphorivorans]MDP3638427.1 hypothetical protein [Azonexus sp.]MDZ4313940.1 hypothetical protein [Azonexus sp.]
MPNSSLWAGALSLLLIHNETGCQQSALNAARLLERLGEMDGVDSETQTLCERASVRLSRPSETQHACAA